MLPAAVVDEIRKSNRTSATMARLTFAMSGVKKEKDAPLAWSFDQVHLLQSDIVGFTKCASVHMLPHSSISGLLPSLYKLYYVVELQKSILGVANAPLPRPPSRTPSSQARHARLARGALRHASQPLLRL